MASFSSVFRKDLFNGKIAVVTGGGSGIGFAIAQELGHLGCTVIIASRSKKQPDKLQNAANKINEFIKSTKPNANNKCIAVKLNVRSSESIEKFFKILTNKHNIKMIDFLINNAGGQYPSLLHDISEKGWKTVIDLNLNGIFLLSKYILNKFWKNNKNNNDKVIINITANSFNGMPTMGHSSVARAGVENLTMVMTQNWSKYGVRINSIAPGFIKSSGLKTYPKPFLQLMGLHTKNNYLFRYGSVEEVSHAVTFLLSDGASFITGASLRVDGGESIYNPLLPPQKPLYKPSKL